MPVQPRDLIIIPLDLIIILLATDPRNIYIEEKNLNVLTHHALKHAESVKLDFQTGTNIAMLYIDGLRDSWIPATSSTAASTRLWRIGSLPRSH